MSTILRGNDGFDSYSSIRGFKNLIINGRKQVNQSGLTTTDNSYNYDNHYKVGNNWFMFIDGKNIVSGEPYTLSWVGAATAGYYIGPAGALTINAQTFTLISNGETITPTITSSQKLWIKFSSDASGSTYNKVQFEPGTTPTPYEQRLYEFELDLVQSCYETSYSTGVPLGTNTSVGSIMLPPYSPSNSASGYNVYFKKVKRAIPISGLYSISGTVARVTIVDSGLETTVATTPQNASTNGFGGWVASGTGNGPSTSRTAFHYYADARPY